MSKPAIIHEWSEPKEVRRFSSGLMTQMGRGFVPRVLVTAAAILLLLYWFLHRTLPDEVLPALDRGLVRVFLGSVGVCCLPFVYALLGRWGPTNYEISEKRISKSDIAGLRVVLWKHVKGYTPLRSSEFPNVISILVHSKRRGIVLWIAKGDLAEQVMRTFGERCPLIPEDEEERSGKPVPSDFEILQLLLTTVAYSGVVGYLLSGHLSRPTLIVVLVITLLAGPGTIGCLLLYGKKTFRNKNVKFFAYVFNLFGLVLVMLALVLFDFYYWSEVIKELEQRGKIDITSIPRTSLIHPTPSESS